VNAGSELARIESLKDIASPTLVLSFVLLSIFPVLIKKVLASLNRKRHQGGTHGTV